MRNRHMLFCNALDCNALDMLRTIQFVGKCRVGSPAKHHMPVRPVLIFKQKSNGHLVEISTDSIL